eukprot:512411_1
MDNINKETWILYSNILNPGRYGARAVIWGNDIIIIGGLGSSQWIKQNQIFHTTTNTISLSYTMTVNAGLTRAAVLNVNVNNTIYTFGGFNGGSLSTIQSITLGQPPTTNPIAMPTQTTTKPSSYPTKAPTINPSSNPSYPITSNPTNSPFEASIFEPVININVTINKSNI